MIEKIKKKQQAEIEQMLMFEISQAKAAQDKAAKVQLEAEKEERAKKERELRAKDAAGSVWAEEPTDITAQALGRDPASLRWVATGPPGGVVLSP